MEVRYTHNDHLRYLRTFILRQIFPLFYELEKIEAIYILGYNIDMIFSLDALFEGDKQRMGNHFHYN